MNCRRVVNLMSAYVDGELTGTDMLAIRRHMSQCPECASEYEDTRLVKQAVSRLRTMAPPKALAATIVGRFDEVEVTPAERFVNWALGFMHGRLSPVAAALTASGVALVMMTAGGIDGMVPQTSQDQIAVLGAYNHEVAFLSEMNRPPVELGAKPLVVASEGPAIAPEVQFAGFSR